MSQTWVDILVKIAIEVVDMIANMLKDEKENPKNAGKGTSETKRKI